MLELIQRFVEFRIHCNQQMVLWIWLIKGTQMPSVTNTVLFLFHFWFMSWIKAEFEQEDCACAVRDSVHGVLATLQVLPFTAWSLIMFTLGLGRHRSTRTCSICSNSTGARYFAAVVPFLNSMRLLTYGLRIYTDEALVKSVSREGKPEYILLTENLYVWSFSMLLCQELCFFTGNFWEVLSIMSWCYSLVF